MVLDGLVVSSRYVNVTKFLKGEPLFSVSQRTILKGLKFTGKYKSEVENALQTAGNS